MLSGVEAFSAGLSADKFHAFFINEICEHANCVGTATHTSDDQVWQAAGAFKHLCFRLSGDDAMKLTHDGRKWVWASRSAKQLVRLMEGGGPVRSASFTASFRVPEPVSTGTTFAPMSSMRKTLGCWRA